MEQYIETGPPPFELITENVYLSDTGGSRDKKKAKKMVCECQFDPELDDPQIACGEDCLNRLLLIECGSRCPCGEYCTNKRFQRAEYAQVEVFKTEMKGWGLRAVMDIQKYVFVMEYCGEVCSLTEFEERKKVYSMEKRRHYYFMSLKADDIIDATHAGNQSRFINHSCDPNCETQKWTVDGLLRIGFFTLRFIPAGDELTFDYQFQRFGESTAQRCFCGSANCRGYLGVGKPVNKLQQSPRSNSASPIHRKEKKRKDDLYVNLLDSDALFEKQVYDIVGSSWRLVNSSQVLAISRAMIHAETPVQRNVLLKVLQATSDEACLKKFLSLQGLRLLWSWMVDSVDMIGHDKLEFRVNLLSTLKHLPISTKNQLEDNKILTVVQKWRQEGMGGAQQNGSSARRSSNVTSSSKRSVDVTVTEADSMEGPITSEKCELKVEQQPRDNLPTEVKQEGEKSEDSFGKKEAEVEQEARATEEQAIEGTVNEPAVIAEVTATPEDKATVAVEDEGGVTATLENKSAFTVEDKTMAVLEDKDKATVAVEDEGGVTATLENKSAFTVEDKTMVVLEDKDKVTVAVEDKLVEDKVTVAVENEGGVTATLENKSAFTVEDKTMAALEDKDKVTATLEDMVTEDKLVEDKVTATLEDKVTVAVEDKLVEDKVTATLEDKVTATLEDKVTVAVEDKLVEDKITAAAEDEVMAVPEDVVTAIVGTHVPLPQESRTICAVDVITVREGNEATMNEGDFLDRHEIMRDDSGTIENESDVLHKSVETVSQGDSTSTKAQNKDVVLLDGSVSTEVEGVPVPEVTEVDDVMDQHTLQEHCDAVTLQSEHDLLKEHQNVSMDTVSEKEWDVSALQEWVEGRTNMTADCVDSDLVLSPEVSNVAQSTDVVLQAKLSVQQSLNEISSNSQEDCGVPLMECDDLSVVQGVGMEEYDHMQKECDHTTTECQKESNLEPDSAHKGEEEMLQETPEHHINTQTDDICMQTDDICMQTGSSGEAGVHKEGDTVFQERQVVLVQHPIVTQPECNDILHQQDDDSDGAAIKEHHITSLVEASNSPTEQGDSSTDCDDVTKQTHHLQQEQIVVQDQFITEHTGGDNTGNCDGVPHLERFLEEYKAKQIKPQLEVDFKQQGTGDDLGTEQCVLDQHKGEMTSSEHDNYQQQGCDALNKRDVVLVKGEDTIEVVQNRHELVEHTGENVTHEHECNNEASQMSEKVTWEKHVAENNAICKEMDGQKNADSLIEAKAEERDRPLEEEDMDTSVTSETTESLDSSLQPCLDQEEMDDAEPQDADWLISEADKDDDSLSSCEESTETQDENIYIIVSSQAIALENTECDEQLAPEHSIHAAMSTSSLAQEQEAAALPTSTSEKEDVTAVASDCQEYNQSAVGTSEVIIPESCEAEGRVMIDSGEEMERQQMSSLLSLANDLLEQWSNLKEVYRIPKRSSPVPKKRSRHHKRNRSPSPDSDLELRMRRRQRRREELGKESWYRHNPNSYYRGSNRRPPRARRRQYWDTCSGRTYSMNNSNMITYSNMDTHNDNNMDTVAAGNTLTSFGNATSFPTHNQQTTLAVAATPQEYNAHQYITAKSDSGLLGAVPGASYNVQCYPQSLMTAGLVSLKPPEVVQQSQQLPQLQQLIPAVSQSTAASLATSQLFSSQIILQHPQVSNPPQQQSTVTSGIYMPPTTNLPPLPPITPEIAAAAAAAAAAATRTFSGSDSTTPPPLMPTPLAPLQLQALPVYQPQANTVIQQPTAANAVQQQGGGAVIQQGYMQSNILPNQLRPLDQLQQSGVLIQQQCYVPTPTTAYAAANMQYSVVQQPTLATLPPPPPVSNEEKNLPENWRTARDPTGKIYYYHAITKKTQWERPMVGDAGTLNMEISSNSDPNSNNGSPRQSPVHNMASSSTTSVTTTSIQNPKPTTNQGTKAINQNACSMPTPDSASNKPDAMPSLPPLGLTTIIAESKNHNSPFAKGSEDGEIIDHTEVNTASQDDSASSITTPLERSSGSGILSKDAALARDQFKHNVSKLVIQCLQYHRKPGCKYGLVTNAEDFKYLARKLTHGLTEKEAYHKKGYENVDFNESVKTKTKEYIRNYMKKFGPIYTRT